MSFTYVVCVELVSMFDPESFHYVGRGTVGRLSTVPTRTSFLGVPREIHGTSWGTYLEHYQARSVPPPPAPTSGRTGE